MNVSILDLNCGNLSSIYNSLKFLDVNVKVTNDKSSINASEAIVFPGNGNFNFAMNNLIKTGFDDLLYENIISKKKPFLGICVGFQVLFSSSNEDGIKTKGLDLFKSDLKLIENKNHTKYFSLPHIGWNTVRTINSGGILSKVEGKLDFYFMHSYAVVDSNQLYATSICEYGEEFISSIEKDNITAVQFHPEKSHDTGIKFLNHWLKKNVKN
jgi:imidazole glycerol phosphate synthase glutamine amidotransferase subunit